MFKIHEFTGTRAKANRNGILIWQECNILKIFNDKPFYTCSFKTWESTYKRVIRTKEYYSEYIDSCDNICIVWEIWFKNKIEGIL